jgi:hypothetical protein
MGTTYWRDAINKEMATVAHVFEFVEMTKSWATTSLCVVTWYG